MESSIAEFLERQLACELLPTVNIRTAVSSLSREVCMSRSLEGDDALKRWEARAYMCTWPEQPHIFIPSRPFGYDQV